MSLKKLFTLFLPRVLFKRPHNNFFDFDKIESLKIRYSKWIHNESVNGMKKYHSWNVVISGREIQRKLKNHLERAVISEEKHFIPFVHAYAGILKYNSRTFHVLTGRVKVGRVTYVILLRELIEGARVFSWTLLDEEAKIFENKLDQMIIKKLDGPPNEKIISQPTEEQVKEEIDDIDFNDPFGGATPPFCDEEQE